MLAQLNDCIGALLHLGPNVITFRALLHLGPNVITFRNLLHLQQLLHLGLQQRCGYRFVSGSPDIFQLRTAHESVQSVYLIYKYSIFKIDTFFLLERKDSSNFYAHNLSLYNLSAVYLLDLSLCF